MSPLSATLSELDRAWVARLMESAAFAAAVGTDESGAPNLLYGWRKYLIEKPFAGAKFVSWYSPYRSKAGETPRRVHIVSDLWVWPSDGAGGLPEFYAIDEVMCDLLGGVAVTLWEAVADESGGTFTVASLCIDAGDPVSAWRRRRRVWQVSPVSVPA